MYRFAYTDDTLELTKQFGWKHSTRTRLICSYWGDTSVSEDGLTREEMTGGISAMFGLGGLIRSNELPLVESREVGQNEEL